jgi:hypothetical protein
MAVDRRSQACRARPFCSRGAPQYPQYLARPGRFEGFEGNAALNLPEQRPGEYRRLHDTTVAPSLEELGIGKMESSRRQAIAAVASVRRYRRAQGGSPMLRSIRRMALALHRKVSVDR